MRLLLRIALLFVLVATMRAPLAQTANAADALIGTWTLAAVDKSVSADEPERIRAPRGLLVLDRAGNVFEFFGTGSSNEPESPQADPQKAFENFGGFWGRYTADATAGRLMFEAASGVSPSAAGQEFVRTYDLEGDRLVVTSTADEPQAQANTRWVWQRMPAVEHLSPVYREVVGFWEHVEEGRLNEETGEQQNSNRRAPSVIVYTPSGFVGVHFPGLGREPFAGAVPTEEEARDGLRGYIGYFGTLGVYPGEVTHNLLSGISPGTGSILRRYADITGDELVVRLQRSVANPPPADGPATSTIVRLRRLSGAEDMLPRE